MDLEKILSNISLLPDDIKQEFKNRLKSFPDNMENWFYGTIDRDTMIQGDIYANIPIFIFNSDNITNNSFNNVGEIMEADVMVLSHSCDIEQGKALDVTVAPLCPLEEIAGLGQGSNRIISIKKNEITNCLYIPTTSSKAIIESIVLLSKISSIPMDIFHSKKPKKLATLSRFGWYFLLLKLTWHFARPL